MKRSPIGFSLRRVLICLFVLWVWGAIARLGIAATTTIDILIVYDTSAASWVTQRGGMDLFAVDAVARMNQAVAGSGVDLSFRLVHTGMTDYVYSGDMQADLKALQTGSGNLARVHDWRETYSADLVAMLVDTGSASDWVGIAYQLNSITGNSAYAYCVGAVRSVDISHTLTHEVGHNLGADHSKKQLDDPGPNVDLNTYSAGWYFNGNNGVGYHTIMAYNDDGFGGIYQEAPLFSSPLITWEGAIAGNARDGDNARTLREIIAVVAAYRVSDLAAFMEQVQEIYVAYYGRPADPAGQTYWAGKLQQAGGDLHGIIQAFGTSAEFDQRYGGMSDDQLLIAIYVQMFNRAPDSAGLNYYLGELSAGRMTMQTITLNVLDGAVNPPDVDIIQNKISVADYYTDFVRRGCDYGTIDTAKSFLDAVDDTDPSVDRAEAAIVTHCGLP